jgi:phosphoglycolate phosphatase/pyrophosphatase PpaX
MQLRYRCLVLDHDDTAVDSTRTIHHPAYVEAMQVLRPGMTPVDLEGWFLKNFHPGVSHYFKHEVGLDEAEVAKELEIWRTHTETKRPEFYPGFLETLIEYQSRGGVITVISHSESHVVRRHYQTDGNGVMPREVYGWELCEGRRKPSAWPLQELMRQMDVRPDEVLVIDDLAPGILMAKAAGVPAAAAAWAHRLGPIEAFMRQHCVAYLESIEAFREYVLAGP